MGDLHEIVDIASVGKLFTWLAILMPIAGAAIGALWGMKKSTLRIGLIRGIVFGLLGPLNWLLWTAFNAISNHTGLDSVRNVVLNMLLFIFVGVILGIGFGKAHRQKEE